MLVVILTISTILNITEVGDHLLRSCETSGSSQHYTKNFRECPRWQHSFQLTKIHMTRTLGTVLYLILLATTSEVDIDIVESGKSAMGRMRSLEVKPTSVNAPNSTDINQI